MKSREVSLSLTIMLALRLTQKHRQHPKIVYVLPGVTSFPDDWKYFTSAFGGRFVMTTSQYVPPTWRVNNWVFQRRNGTLLLPAIL